MPLEIGRLYAGRLVRWERAKGYGFIRPDDGGQDIFVHASALGVSSEPEVGSRWVFSVGDDPRGRGPRAAKAVPEESREHHARALFQGPNRSPHPERRGAPRSGRRPRGGRDGSGSRGSERHPRPRDQTLRPLTLNWRTSLVGMAALFCVAVAALRADILGWLLLIYPVMSLAAYLLYARDKLAALRGQWRVAESSLHLMELLGGWPGAFLAQETMRHKTIKGSYQFVFWLIVALHVGLAAVALTDPRLIAEFANGLV